jgi:Fic family protein
MRTYERTHPWLTFQLDLRRLPYLTWLALGEAQSKAQHVAGVPLLPAVQERFHEVFLAKGALATTAIEGNTLTEEEVLKQLRGELKVPASKEYLLQEVENIIEACKNIGRDTFEGRLVEIRVEEIRAFNRLVLRKLPLPSEVSPGEFRTYSVGVGRYRGAPPEDIPYLMDRYCAWMNEDFRAPPGHEVAFGILRAIVSHLYLAWIHPFGDGNGRTARLLEFQALLSVGVPSVAAHLLSNHYNETRSDYYQQLDAAHRSGGDILPFLNYALRGFVDQLKEQIETIKGQQRMVHWVNYLHDLFRDQDTKPGIRRRRLAIDLSLAPGIVSVAQVRHVTPRMAEIYAGKTDKTVKRDLTFLENRGLIERRHDGIRVKTERILAFLPAVRKRN